ncbi:hypothetical protein WJX79_002283 [Trebouxia sp. C0005]
MHTRCSARCSAAQQSCFGHNLGQRKLALLTYSVRRQCNLVSRPVGPVVQAQVSPPEDQQEEVEYKDTWSDVQFINLCRRAYGNLAGWQSSKDWNKGETTYEGMLEVSRALMKGKSASQQRDAVIKGFPKVPNWFRKVFPYSKWGAELNAQITPAFFSWLVGPMYTETADVNGVQQRSSVHIKRCRYLAGSGCVGMCVNLCKTPTQTFFTEELGMPLTMKPNFDDYSCDMIFGQMPPSLDADEVNSQACYDACPQGKAGDGKCHKLS